MENNETFVAPGNFSQKNKFVPENRAILNIIVKVLQNYGIRIEVNSSALESWDKPKAA